MAKITYTDKVNLVSQPVPNENKVTAENLNEIKVSVNQNVDDIALKAAINGSELNTFKVADATLTTQAINKGQFDTSFLKVGGTGVTSSYVSTVSVGGTTFAQPAVNGEIHGDQGNFTISYVGATGVTVSNLTAPSTYVYIDNAGALQQQTTTPTRQDWSRKMFTMRIGVDIDTNLILGFEYLNNPIGHYANSIRDLYTYLLAQGIPFKKDQVITGRAGDLGFDVSAGSFFEFGGTGEIHEPNTPSLDAVANADFTLIERTSINGGGTTNLPKFWDNNGVLTALGSTTFVGHRLYRFANGNFAIQYGQANYANIDLAKIGIRTEEYVLNPILKNATLFGWWLIEDTATNTGGTTLTDFVEYTIGVQGGSSSSLSGALLKGNNLSDLLDAATARTNLGVTALDNANVKLTGAQSIAGEKQFTDSIGFSEDVTVIGDLDVTGSITTNGDLSAATLTPTVLTTGNIPYKSANELLDSPISTNGTDVTLSGSTLIRKLVIAPSAQNGTIDGLVVAYNDNGASASIRAQMYINAFNGQMELKNGSDNIVVKLSSNSKSYFNGGNVLIGTTTDNGSKLQVNGAATFASSLTANTKIRIEGDKAKLEFYDISDADTASIEFNSVTNEFEFSQGITTTNEITATTTVSGANIRTSTSYTFATLPAGPIGLIAHITDASTISYRADAAGGGSAYALVTYDGTKWIYH
ncbi:MAG: hypothetical protein ACJA2M_000805 [Polaribacter sp.]|jgi:hypothetical protein